MKVEDITLKIDKSQALMLKEIVSRKGMDLITLKKELKKRCVDKEVVDLLEEDITSCMSLYEQLCN